MGVYIKALQMPKDSELLCINIHPDGKVSINLDLQCKQIATAIDVPSHGDLIDADALIAKVEHDTPLSDVYEKTMRRYLENAPTIIEAEEETKES